MIKAITGTRDTLPEDMPVWYRIESSVRSLFSTYNYQEIRTPVFEETALFKRGIGEDTDIVSKEMYSFTDRGDTHMTLKPEGTAPVVRAYIEHALGSKQPLQKLFYISPMFRQERPQAGRLRQFHQFGAEALGSKAPQLDAEMIIIAYNLLKSFGLNSLEVCVNSLGKPETREQYKAELRNYLADKLHGLSTESKKRYETNILRLFDSKESADIEIMKDAPLLIDYLDDEDKEHFQVVTSLLQQENIPFKVEPRLVRGLDYYTKTTFEIISGSVGSQSALCGGGRYDNLIEQLGGQQTPGVGFAAGIERIILALQNENALQTDAPKLSAYLIRLEEERAPFVFGLAQQLRNAGISADFDYHARSIKAQMREANRLGAKVVLFCGGNEYAAGTVAIKRMSDGTQETVPFGGIINTITKLIG